MEKNTKYLMTGILVGIAGTFVGQNLELKEKPLVKERGLIKESFQPYFISTYDIRTEIYVPAPPCGPNALPGKLQTSFIYVDKENDGKLDYKKNLLGEIKNTLILPSDFWQKEYEKFQKKYPEIYSKK